MRLWSPWLLTVEFMFVDEGENPLSPSWLNEFVVGSIDGIQLRKLHSLYAVVLSNVTQPSLCASLSSHLSEKIYMPVWAKAACVMKYKTLIICCLSHSVIDVNCSKSASYARRCMSTTDTVPRGREIKAFLLA